MAAFSPCSHFAMLPGLIFFIWVGGSSPGVMDWLWVLFYGSAGIDWLWVLAHGSIGIDRLWIEVPLTVTWSPTLKPVEEVVMVLSFPLSSFTVTLSPLICVTTPEKPGSPCEGVTEIPEMKTKTHIRASTFFMIPPIKVIVPFSYSFETGSTASAESEWIEKCD